MDYNKAKLVIAMYDADVTFKEATKIITNEYIKEINE